jgi:hypothetical protein
MLGQKHSQIVPGHKGSKRMQGLTTKRSLCPAGDLQAVLVANPTVAAAVAEICMVGLATTVHATRGPPKPDKARIDRLAYVVSAWPPSSCPCTPSALLYALLLCCGVYMGLTVWRNPKF